MIRMVVFFGRNALDTCLKEKSQTLLFAVGYKRLEEATEVGFRRIEKRTLRIVLIPRVLCLQKNYFLDTIRRGNTILILGRCSFE